MCVSGERLPDATYTSWDQIGSSLREAIATPPAEPVVPESEFAAYAGKPLVEKLGIKANWVVDLVGAPADFVETLGDLPPEVRLREEAKGGHDLTIWFTRSRKELHEGLPEMAARAEGAPLWIAWPKKASKMATDLGQQDVREAGLAVGLVDYKVYSIDQTWSGLLFRQRKPK